MLVNITLPEHKNVRRKMNTKINQKQLLSLNFVLTVFACVIIITPFVNIQTAKAQGIPPVFLNILNEPDSSGQIYVVKGESVQVEFLCIDLEPTESDMIQLVRKDNGEVVSTVMTEGEESGLVLLSTEPDNSLGELQVMYARSAAVILTAEQTVFVVPSVPPEPPTFVEVPSPEAPTIQAAIDMVADGGIIEISPGVFNEQIVISGKDVHIIGSGSGKRKRKTVITAAEPTVLTSLYQSEALVRFESGGGSISNMAFKGGDVGIFLDNSTELTVDDIDISRTGHGVAGKAKSLTMSDSIISELLGIAVLAIESQALELLDNWISDTEGVGILVYNFEGTGGDINIQNQTLWFNGQGGIIVAGGAKPVYIRDCQINFSGSVGILLIYTYLVDVLNTTVAAVTETSVPTYEGVADGLIAHNSTQVNITDCKFLYADRAGILYDHSGGTILDSIAEFGRLGLVSLDSPNLSYDHSSNSFKGTEQDIISNTNLPVPDAPPPLPDP